MCNDSECSKTQAACECPGARLERFIQPAVLMLLYEGEAHGYALLSRLPEIGWPELADPGTVYRTLRRMEQDGLVASQWDTDGPGPARRLYRITGDGEAVLSAWVDNIKDNIRVLAAFVRRFHNHSR